ncbi:hypothetical protein DPMN_034639 [Dreissena polymorpha]|uniref:Plastocyanin-like domain-containing protein n=1 Tax=Dreissena polymorpha TaxID=45954 RepID=A0A9D4M9G1_DREPO|nr:hypothetical protein DPMN_034639 [Dreissena polymorpha]
MIPNANFRESRIYFSKSHNGKRLIGGTYRKSRFVEYMTINYTARVNRTTEEEHLGLLGPVIRAEVGDAITVILNNTCPHNVSISLQGVSLAISQSGVNS